MEANDPLQSKIDNYKEQIRNGKFELDTSNLKEEDILWNSAGMHRPIASFWYNYIFILLAAIPGLVVFSWLIPTVLLPYPSALGIADVVVSYFQFMFVMFDVGTGVALQRFVAEHAVSDPKRALKYVQFFSWFQLFSGLIQTTIIAVWVFVIITPGDNGFLSWPFLIYSLTQYPGMLMVYKNALGAFQRHDKQIIVELFQNILFQSLTQIIFILVGRAWGGADPGVGEVMGAAIGYIVGSYIDDFIGMWMGAHFFSQVIQPLGFDFLDTLRPCFSKSIAKEVILYGLKVVPAYAIEAAVRFLVLHMTMNWLPNYTTIIAIVQLANAVATVTSISFTITPAISESYNNGYHNLTQYYIKQQWKHWFLIAMFLFIAVYMIIPPAFRVLSGDYAIAAELVPIMLITRMVIFPINFGSAVAQGINKPEYQTFALFFEQTARAISFYALLNPQWGLITIIGSEYALMLYVFADFPAFCVKLITQWWFVKRKIHFSIGPAFFQTFVAVFLTMIPLIIVLWIPMQIFEMVAANSTDLVVPIVILALTLLGGLFLVPIYVLFPFYGLFGGWDDDGLEAFILAAKICGPSKFLVNLMAKYTRWGHEHCPWKNRHSIPYGDARQEAEELSKIRIKIYLENNETSEI